MSTAMHHIHRTLHNVCMSSVKIQHFRQATQTIKKISQPKHHANTPLGVVLFRGMSNQAKKSLTPVQEVEAFTSGFRCLLKPTAFGLMVCGCSFAGAAIWQYESMRSTLKEAMKSGQNKINEMFVNKAGGIRSQINYYWNSLTPGQKAVAAIIAGNFGVFCLWKVMPLQRFMLTYFASNPMSGAPSLSLVGSMFSHYSFLHFGVNMYVLWSFAPTISHLLGREQFMALYLSAGMVSGLASYAYKVARFSLVPSLGASGAIMAVLGAVCTCYPEARLSIAFVDYLIPHSFTAGNAIKFIILFDSLGVVFGWRFFDHAAHLGGLLFGMWYVNYGRQLIWKNREPMMKRWHELRN